MTTTHDSSSRMLSGVRELIGAEVLVIDQDERVTKGVTQLLSAASLHVTTIDEPHAAFDLMHRKFFSVVVVDLDTPTPNAGLDTVREIKTISPTSMVIMLTPRKSYSDAVESIRAGAIDIILKSPESVSYLKDRVLEAAGRSVNKREVNSVLVEVKKVYDEFLDLFMKSERRALDLSDQLAGRDPKKLTSYEEIRVLVVEDASELGKALAASEKSGYSFQTAASGGQALDLCSSAKFHIVMVAGLLHDLPGSMVIRSVKTQNPEVVAIEFQPPGPQGKVEIVESTKRIDVIDSFTDPKQLLDRLDEIAEAFRAKSRERRYTQAFRERHYDFLRRYVELKLKVDRAMSEG